jgi:hypothetical protein
VSSPTNRRPGQRVPIRLALAAATAASLIGTVVLALPAAAAAATTWYVSASAAPGGTGSQKAPFNSLATVQAASQAGDTIIVAPSAPSVPPLDGGIALKPNQHLLGGGPSVVAGSLTNAPRITNSSAAQNSGDAVELAGGDVVTNLQIAGAYRGAIYGANVSGVTVSGNDVSAWNPSCANGLNIPQFTFPTDAPGVGAILAGGINNGWAAIMIADTSATGNVSIGHNNVHDSACGDGIDLQLAGTANLTAAISNNTLTRLDTSGQQASVLAIGMKTTGTSTLSANLTYNTQTYIGGLDTDSEGFFGFPGDASHMAITVDHNTFAHGIGGTAPNGRSGNGMEFVILSGHPTASMSIANSTFYDASGDLMEELNWGVNSTMHLSLSNVTASHSTGLGDDHNFPFNNGDCLLESSAGAGTTTTLAVTGTHLSDCVNNGLTVDNNVVNGTGPATDLTFDVKSSSITGNKADNLHLINSTSLTRLAGTVQNTNLSGSTGTNVAFDQLAGYDQSGTGYAALDLGGGALGSKGNNCIFGGGQLDAETTGYNVFAEHNWWGTPTGPGLGRVVAINSGWPTSASIQTSPFLTTKPTTC